MDQSEEDVGTMTALILRMDEVRLPRVRRLQLKVNAGELLDDSDIDFLKRVHDDYQANQALFQRNPEYSRIMSRFIDLYAEIINKGLANEKTR